jgi:hypothetical protein
MSINQDFLTTIALAADRYPDPHVIPWPMPSNLGGFISFQTYQEWQAFVLGFSLHQAVPQSMAQGYVRAQKLHLLAWIDFDLITAGELAALATLEYVLRDCYLRNETDRRRHIITEEESRTKKPPRKGQLRWIEQAGFTDLLTYMVEHDGLTDEKVPMIEQTGGSIINLITGKRMPSLADMRHSRAHGNPFESGFQAGLLQLIRDLIEYAYRDRISQHL